MPLETPRTVEMRFKAKALVDRLEVARERLGTARRLYRIAETEMIDAEKEWDRAWRDQLEFEST